MFLALEHETFVAHYDVNKQMACLVLFNNSLKPELFEILYQWIAELRSTNHAVHAVLINLSRLRRFPGAEDRQLTGEILARYPDIAVLPHAFVVANIYQERKLIEHLDNIPPLVNKQVVQDYLAAFDYVDTYHKLDEIEVHLPRISTRLVSGWHNQEKTAIIGIYYGVVTVQSTEDIYRGIFAFQNLYGLEGVRAGIFDFRHVSNFDNSNLHTVKRSSSAVNMNFDMSHIAAPIIAGDLHQEQMVSMAMKVSPQEERKKIVSSLKKGYEFIEAFHENIKA